MLVAIDVGKYWILIQKPLVLINPTIPLRTVTFLYPFGTSNGTNP
jgi:hypothetical protein